MVALSQYDYLFAIGTIFAALDAWVSPIHSASPPHPHPADHLFVAEGGVGPCLAIFTPAC